MPVIIGLHEKRNIESRASDFRIHIFVHFMYMKGTLLGSP